MAISAIHCHLRPPVPPVFLSFDDEAGFSDIAELSDRTALNVGWTYRLIIGDAEGEICKSACTVRDRQATPVYSCLLNVHRIG